MRNNGIVILTTVLLGSVVAIAPSRADADVVTFEEYASVNGVLGGTIIHAAIDTGGSMRGDTFNPPNYMLFTGSNGQEFTGSTALRLTDASGEIRFLLEDSPVFALNTIDIAPTLEENGGVLPVTGSLTVNRVSGGNLNIPFEVSSDTYSYQTIPVNSEDVTAFWVSFDSGAGYGGGQIDNITINNPIPEPASLSLLALGGLALLRRRSTDSRSGGLNHA